MWACATHRAGFWPRWARRSPCATSARSIWGEGRVANPFAVLRSQSVRVRVPVRSGPDVVGHLELVSDTSDLGMRLVDILLVGLVAMILAGAVGLAILDQDAAPDHAAPACPDQDDGQRAHEP